MRKMQSKQFKQNEGKEAEATHKRNRRERLM